MLIVESALGIDLCSMSSSPSACGVALGFNLADDSERHLLVVREFEHHFGGPPKIWVRAPGRVDWMGSHTDYNQGFVLTMSIDRDTWIAARPRADRAATIYSLNLPGGGPFSLDDIQHDADSPWTDYVRGVAKVFQDAGYPLQGFDGLIHSTVPVGAGVSSSAALEVATAQLFKALAGWEIDPVELARFCQRAENEFVGMRCGILDQYSSVMGRAEQTMLLDCRSITSRAVPIPEGIELVLCDTRADRKLTGSGYASRRADCEEGARLLGQLDDRIKALRDASPDLVHAHRQTLPETIFRRCLFVTQENQRVLDTAEALQAGDLPALAGFMARSFQEARDLFEIVSPEMEQMIQVISRAPGVIGARQAGAGFGGCIVAAVQVDQSPAFVSHVVEDYASLTNLQAAAFPLRASPGAGLLAPSV
jgi:galactokinase